MGIGIGSLRIVGIFQFFQITGACLPFDRRPYIVYGLHTHAHAV